MGYFYGGSFRDYGTYAGWWSSTSGSMSGSSTSAYILGENTSGNIDPSNRNSRRHGFSVRCAAKIIKNIIFNANSFDSSWHPAYVGYFGASSFGTSSTGAYWWSSTSGSSTNAYNLYEYTSGNITPSSNDVRKYGFSVRCVAKYRPTIQFAKRHKRKFLWRKNLIEWYLKRQTSSTLPGVRRMWDTSAMVPSTIPARTRTGGVVRLTGPLPL